MNVPRIDKDASEQLKKFDEFDEEWEQVLYRLCKTDKYLQKNAINISQLFNMIRTEILNVATINMENIDTDEDIKNAKDNVIREFIQDQMSQSSITGFSANDSTPLEYDWGQLMRDVQWRLYLYAKSKFPDVEFSVPRVRYNGVLGQKAILIYRFGRALHIMVLRSCFNSAPVHVKRNNLNFPRCYLQSFQTTMYKRISVTSKIWTNLYSRTS